MSGFPPLLGFIGKELLYEAKLHAPDAAFAITAAGVTANVFMVAVAILVGFKPFHGAAQLPATARHEAPLALWLGPLVLAGLGLVAGLFPALVDRPLLAGAVSALRGEETRVVLKLWHGINPVLLLSVATVLAGGLVFALRERVRRLAAWLAPLARVGPERGYALGLKGLVAFAELQTRLLQHGYLRGYILTVLAVAVGLAGFALARFGPVPLWIGWGDVRPHELALAGLILAAALTAARASSRLAAVVALGVVGYGIALLYALYGAPDLAITQILVETLTLVLFVLVVAHLPRFSALSSPRRRRVDALLAALGGIVITLLVLKALHVETGPRVSTYHIENAARAQGRNVVNVILVDFRALDTLGEIVVLATAALGVVALLQLRPGRRKGGG
jgi:multicomponent Na+:H+ antiporter subunit A